MNKECVSCIKRKTPYCPTSMECMATEDTPYYQNRMMLLKENEQLKDNWNELKEFIVKEYYMYLPLEASTKSITILINKMQEIEQGSDKDGSDKDI